MPTLAATELHPGRRFATGLAVSILLHVLMLTVLRPPAPSVAPDARRWSTPLEIRVQLLPPPPEPFALPAPTPPVQQRSVVPRKPDRSTEVQRQPERPAAAARRKPPEAIYLPTPRAPDISAEPTPSAPQPPEPAGNAPRFDPEAAKATARGIASTLDPPKSDAPNAQANRDGPRYRETKEQRLGRNINDSARPNCKDGVPGGLLAPLYLMMDKKDSGCKW
jgi:hypothetical protein